jgi:hypothetical protein
MSREVSDEEIDNDVGRFSVNPVTAFDVMDMDPIAGHGFEPLDRV